MTGAPFGSSDGARTRFNESDDSGEGFIELPSEFGPIARPISEFERARVIAGTRGVGKTLYLRRLHAHFAENPSVLATPLSMRGSELSTETVVSISQKGKKAGGSDIWKRIWDRAIHLSAATFALEDAKEHGHAYEEHITALRSALAAQAPDVKSTNTPLQACAYVCSQIESFTRLDNYLESQKWVTLVNCLHRVLEHSRAIYMFIDAIDDEYRWAPVYWLACQKGLFYAVMDVERQELEHSKLHVVIAVRDHVVSSVGESEHALRYMQNEDVLVLRWGWDSCLEFLRQKVARIDISQFPDARSLVMLLQDGSLFVSARNYTEQVESYLLRHTLLAPRDIVIQANHLYEALRRKSTTAPARLEGAIEESIRHQARPIVRSALGQVANQILTNVLPRNAAASELIESYLLARSGHGSLDENSSQYPEHSEPIVHALIGAIRRTTSEQLDQEALLRFLADTNERFGAKARTLDSLWQARLLGYVHDGRLNLYGGSIESSVTLPMQPAGAVYAFHPIVHEATGTDTVISEGKPLLPDSER